MKSLNGNNNQLLSVTINNNEEEKSLDCDYIFFCYGYNTALAPPSIPVSINSMESSIPGIFAIGSANIYPQKRELITSGMWESRIALHHLKRF